MHKWISQPPTLCDICHERLAIVFIDGRTVMGPWGIMCTRCHTDIGVGLGTGKGQKYSLSTLDKLEG
jgi:hypothetical protein